LDDRLFSLAERLGVRVEYADLPPDRDGEYYRDRALIRLQHRMPARLHRSVLAHECAHARYGDAPARVPALGAKQEVRADEWAALQLIDRDDYARAEALHDAHPGAMAVELGVTSDLIDAYRRVLSRRERP
jgi:hypothetical protein